VIRVPVEGIRISGRDTQGVKVMNLTAGDLVVDVARIVREDDDEAGDDDKDEAVKPRDVKPKKGRAVPTGKKK
jgi:DNA gyrase subunit A